MRLSTNILYARLSIALIAFAANSIICRFALADQHIDPTSFTIIRLATGAITLWLLVRIRYEHSDSAGSWLSGLALFIYAVGFSFAYVSMSAATGALLLFGTVQMTMLAYALQKGHRLQWLQKVGVVISTLGLIALLWPSVETPPIIGAIFMIISGIAWAFYTIIGTNSTSPILNTAGSFYRAALFALLLIPVLIVHSQLDTLGVIYSIVSGSLTSAIAYAIWYSVLPELGPAKSATLQLLVPLITTVGGILLLDEYLSDQIIAAAFLILAGLWLVVSEKHSK